MKTFKTPKGSVLPLRDMKGKDYLDVPYRVQWMREEHADWSIETSFLRLDEKVAIAHSTIRDGNGKIIAQATKTETPVGFPDYVEKAETGSVGRALAFCGYGTQFAQAELAAQLDDDAEENIVDAPKERPASSRSLATGTVVPINPLSGGGITAGGSDLGAFVLKFGKYNGQRLDQITIHDLKNYCAWLKSNAKPGQDDTAIKAMEAFLNSRVPKGAQK